MKKRKRLSISTAVRIRCDDWTQFQTEHAQNISMGGIFIGMPNPFRPGTLFKLDFNVGQERIRATAQVIWTKEFSRAEGRSSGMGARFVEMDDSSKQTLFKWLDQFEQDLE